MFSSLPGFREFYPEDCAARNHIFNSWRKTSKTFGFQEFDGPLLEPLELFTAKSGDEIVSQLFNFEDQGGRKVALRPEMTPTLARLVGARANGLPKPIKWFNIGEHFRYERPQKGRLRSFYQFNGDILGEASPKADAEVIALMIQLLRNFGTETGDFIVRLSDRDLWVFLLESYGLVDKEIEQALSIVDKMERLDEEKILEGLKAVLADNADKFYQKAQQLTKIHTLEELKAFLKNTNSDKLKARIADWEVLINYLEAFGYSDYIKIDLSIVRGLAYYTGFVFEAFQLIGEGRALAGGGRYDHLVKKLGGPDVPAVGFAMGDVTLRNFLELKGTLPQYVEAPQYYAVFEDETSRKHAMASIASLRNAGYRVEYPLKEQSYNKQIKAATQSGAKFGLFIGESEVSENTLTIKSFQTKEEAKVPTENLLEFACEMT